ncbi:U-box domain-containing protein 19-like [Cornus florida]|uniref:U-box domain-containing protein 19-like n=1 Tax=Cornus florida TaxID=4283 RepID=UPI00289A1BE2|nr:U-box domain-containing protein 19-like [Cornus florida]
MIQKLDRNDRRVLTFPAVHPCESISPATLLGSLITLSRSICDHQRKPFATQKRNARESIRQIGILLLFLEEIQDRGLNLSNSIVLCFSELHLTFQKLQFLLQDCSRDGSRFWVLMKSHFVSTQFRVLIRAVATALDVLPLSSIDLSCEIRELVELVAKQSRKAKIELDPEDEMAMKRVILILNQFENKFEPEPSMIKRVLDYLEIRSWSDCNKEIEFLDEEIELGSLDADDREVPLLSSLVGLMSYCRGVLFESSVFGKTEQTDTKCSFEMVGCLNPEDFRCPISLELMTDPVTVATGQTYDRASIQKWLKSGNLLCPKTGKKLTNTELVPNFSLKKLIQQFCSDNGISLSKSRKNNRDITRTIVPGCPAAGEAMKLLAGFLTGRLCYGTHEQKKKAAYEIRLLAKSSIFNRSCLVESGTIPPLLKLLNSNDPSMEENSTAALLKLSKHANGKKVIIDNGGLKPILGVLESGLKLEVRQIAAAIFFYLSSVPDYRKLIGDFPGAIKALVELIKNGTNCGKKNAVVAIFGLLQYHPNHQRVLASGIVPLLVDLLGTPDRDDLTTDSLAVLAALAESINGAISIVETDTALPSIMKALASTTSRTVKEHCVSILLSLCSSCGRDVLAVLAKDASVMTLLYSLVTDGTSHTSKKARLLIRLLQKFHETSSSCLANAVPREHFIHVQ